MWTNLQTMAAVQRHLLALGLLLPGTSVQMCREGKGRRQVLFEEGAKGASSSSRVAANLFYLCLVRKLGLGDNDIIFLDCFLAFSMI